MQDTQAKPPAAGVEAVGFQVFLRSHQQPLQSIQNLLDQATRLVVNLPHHQPGQSTECPCRNVAVIVACNTKRATTMVRGGLFGRNRDPGASQPFRHFGQTRTERWRYNGHRRRAVASTGRFLGGVFFFARSIVFVHLSYMMLMYVCFASAETPRLSYDAHPEAPPSCAFANNRPIHQPEVT